MNALSMTSKASFVSQMFLTNITLDLRHFNENRCESDVRSKRSECFCSIIRKMFIN